MNGLLILLVLVLCMILVLAAGLPLAFSLGGLGLLFLILFIGPKATIPVFGIVYGTMLDFLLTAIPMYLLMGNLLQVSGIAEDLYRTMYLWIGRLPGGLAVGTILICVVFAAMAGMSGPAAVTMGLVALPSMLRRGYNKSMAMGSIMAGGALGILIPPSITMIVFGYMSGASVGKLFMAGLLPGLLLALMLTSYVLLRCFINPELAPPLPADVGVSISEKVASLRSVVLPIILIISVLGSIFFGICTATEAAAIGAGGTFALALLARRLSLKALAEALSQTLILTGMILWIMFGALVFNTFYMQQGLTEQITQWVLGSNMHPILVIGGIQFLLFLMGMFLDPGGIIVVSVPLFAPIVEALGFNLLWFGVLFVINMEMAYLTPPFGINLFFLKAVAPKGTSMGEIYRSVGPFILIQAIALVVVMVFPEIALMIPEAMK